MFKIYETIPDVKIFEHNIFKDERGYFFEFYNQDNFSKSLEKDIIFVQDNYSKSKRGVLRGMHYQKPPYTQGKLVSVINGCILDVFIDLRKDSPTYKNWGSVHLYGELGDYKSVYIPEGFAHGFYVLSDIAEVFYKCTNAYHPKSEGGLRYDDPDIGIVWPEIASTTITVSNKDLQLPYFKDLENPF